MKFVFFGSPRFAEIVLKKMIEGGCKPNLVICNPDRPFGRKKVITPPLTKILAKEYEIEVWQPEKLDVEGFEREVDGVDFAVVAAYAKIIPQRIVDFPNLGTIGVHPSLLPKYRGASPIQTAILKGEKETGVTLYLMDEKLDHGPILAQRKTIIGAHENYLQLEKRLAEMGGELLAEILPDFSAEKIKPRVQDETLVTFTKKFVTQDAFIEPRDLELAEGGSYEKALEIHRKVRAFVLEPGAWTTFNKKRVKILETDIVGKSLKLKKIQVEGEKVKEVGSRK
ncbi:MAG: methionyl-tRNA formyltransferase [Candidatus Liptonbacteria bacterium]|nr:methionyl-tRNA formyltransferase [Candidatus Liptonbacteria bacterium]